MADVDRVYTVADFDEWLPADVPARPNGSDGPPFTVPSTIHDGERNTVLYRSARSLHAKGFSTTAIHAALDAENTTKCDPPLPADEVAAIAAHAATQADAPDFDATPGPRATVGATADAHAPTTEEPPSFVDACPAFLARFDGQPRPADLIAGLVPGVGTAMLHGQPRTMKTLALFDIALTCATGTIAFGLPVLVASRSVPVWYISEEDPRVEVRDRLQALLAGRSMTAPDQLHLSIQQAVDLDDPRWQAAVLAYAQAHGIALTIVDPVRASTAGADQGPRELKPFAAFLRAFTRETGSVFLLGHHDVKPPRDGADTRSRPQRASGGGIFSIVDCPIHAERIDDARVLFTPAGYKFGAAPAPFVVRLQADASSHPTWMRLVGEVTTGTDAIRIALHEQLVAFLREHPGTSGNKIASGLRHNRNETFAALDALRHAGVVDYYTKGQAHLWFIPASEEKTPS